MIDRPFGEVVADPWRWLEGDLRSSPRVADWARRQDALARGYLATLPARAWFTRRIRALSDYERFGLPVKAGGRYFYTRNAGLQDQPQLWVRRGLGGAPRLLLDPGGWGGDGALAGWEPSRSGRHVAYAVQRDGSDWRRLRVVDVRSRKRLTDEVEWAKFTQIAWIGDGGFLYSRYPAPTASGAPDRGQAVWFHRLGTPQSADEPVYATPDRPELRHTARVTWDARWAVIASVSGTDARAELHAIALAGQLASPLDAPMTGPLPRRAWRVLPLVDGFDHEWRLIEGQGDSLYLITDRGAARNKVVRADLDRWIPPGRRNGHSPALGCGPVDGEPCLSDADPPWTFHDVIPEKADPLDRAQLVGDGLILSYLAEGGSRAEMVGLDGKPLRRIALGAIGTASGFSGRPGDAETFFTYSSFAQPGAVYRFDTRTATATPFAVPRPPFAAGDYAIERRSFAAKDGTRVPLYVVRKKSLAAASKAAPTLLYGYGGFDVSLTPGFSPARLAWLEAGGVFAMASLRGGGEFGREWRDAGRRANKQNVFDDFIAAGEYLIAKGITPKGALAIQGGSNGGLLIGAVLNQRPDLFAAANPQVPVMDMLRFDRFTSGGYWIDDYGSPAVEADWRVLRAYSPYHNLRPGAAYPAVLVTTSDTDDRVVPAHSFKYTAALQAADPSGKPHLLRIEPGTGHGSGKPTDKAIAENADILAFLAEWTGLRPQ